MITSITKQQEQAIETYKTKWLEAGKSTAPTNKEKAIQAMKLLYKITGVDFPSYVKFVASPLEANILIHSLKGKKEADRIEFEYFTHSVLWSSYYGHYDYILNEIFPDKKKDFALFTEFTEALSSFFGCYMYDNAVIICDFPSEINTNALGQLHKDGGASMLFRDGYALYNLNGVAVTEDVAKVKAQDITRDMIFKETNADVRRELIRKLKPEQLEQVLDAKVMDTLVTNVGTYTLLNISINGDRTRPFLKMTNPSINTVHIEGVDPSCKTVADAIKFRNGLSTFSLPQALDGFEITVSNVGNYDQQGDCIVTPVDAIPSEAVACNHNIAGDGLVRHLIDGGKLFEANNIRYIEVEDMARIVHPEHKDLHLPCGTYKVTKVMEYDHFLEEARQVID